MRWVGFYRKVFAQLSSRKRVLLLRVKFFDKLVDFDFERGVIFDFLFDTVIGMHDRSVIAFKKTTHREIGSVEHFFHEVNAYMTRLSDIACTLIAVNVVLGNVILFSDTGNDLFGSDLDRTVI